MKNIPSNDKLEAIILIIIGTLGLILTMCAV